MSRAHLARWILAVMAAVAFLARLLPVVHGAGLASRLFYDDGVYYAASASLVSGRVPYRDFLLLHPPAVTLVVAPFALIGRWTTDPTGLVLGRLAFMAVGALTAVLVALVARRLSVTAGYVAGFLYAVWVPAAHSETSTLLEPLVNVGLAASLLVLGDPRTASRKRLLGAGALLGVACATKLWALVPLVVLAVWVWRSVGARALGRFVGGAAGAATLVCLPFFLLAPQAMTRMVLFDQASRTGNGVGIASRVAGIVSITDGAPASVSTRLALVGFALLAVLLVCTAAVAWRIPLARPWAALLVAQLATLLVVAAYFAKYADFTSVPIALIAGSTVHLVLWRVRRTQPSLVVPTMVGAVLLLVVLGAVRLAHSDGHAVPASWVAAKTAGAHCVAVDNPVLLVQANLLTRNLDRGCEVAVDPTGAAYDLAGARLGSAAAGSSRSHDVPWQHWVTDYYLDADAFVVDRQRGSGFDRNTLRCLRTQRLLGTRGGLSVYAVRAPGGSEGRQAEGAERHVAADVGSSSQCKP